LKAFLIKHGWKLKKIHRLDALLDEVIKISSEFSMFYDLCERVSSYYMADRCPPIGELEIDMECIKKDLDEGRELIKKLFPDEEL